MTFFHKIAVSILFVVTVLTAGGNGAENRQLTGDDLNVLKVVETMVQLGRQFSDSIWPGYNLNQLPLIVYVPERWALLVNAPSHADGFIDYPDEWPDLPTPALYYPGQYQQLVGQLVFDLPVESTAVAAVGFIGQDRRSFLEYIIHENFHQFQHTGFGEIPWAREELYPIEDPVNISLACLEMHLLRNAMEFINRGEEDSVRNQAAKFVAVRFSRWRLADSYVGRYEQGQEINEGTAKYVEMRAIGFVPSLQLDTGLESATGPLLKDELMSVSIPDNIMEMIDRLISSGAVSPENMPRNRIYPVGAAQGFLLDHFAVDWKPAAQRAGSDFTMAGLLGKALSVDSSAYDSLVARAKKQNAFDMILDKSRALIAKYRRGFDSALAVFESQPGTRVELSFDGKNLRRSGSSTAKKWLADNGTRELHDYYEVYVLQSLAGGDFSLQLKRAGLLELNDWTTRNKTAIFFCPKVTSCLIDGKLQNLVEGFDCQFNDFQLIGEDFEISTTRKGGLSVTDRGILISLLP